MRRRRSIRCIEGWHRTTTVLLTAACLWAAGRVFEPAGGTLEAYIGPGAGIALLGSFFAVFAAALSAFFFVLSWPLRMIWRGLRGARPYAKARVKKIVVLGLDGLEPTLTEAFLAAGRLPNLAKLRAQGGYNRLGTTCPPLSPVAWSSFSTGTNPGKHNIYDFISRNAATYRPTQSSVHVGDSRHKLKIGRLVIPLSKPRIDGLRKSKPFWNVLGENGIFSAVLRVPITFPPDRFRGVQLSAMCVPDLRGTHGMFSYFTENGQTDEATDGEVGGDVITVQRNGNTVRSFLRGPPNTLLADQPELRLPFKVTQGADGGATLHINGQKIPLIPNLHTEWIAVHFRTLGIIKVRGVCRFFLKQFDKPFELYCTPIQIDPEKPIMPISHPRNYSTYLARFQGTFSTLGLAEDTWSLSEGRMDEDAFLAQAYDIHAEREEMFFDALNRVPRGVVICVFDGPDRIQHMFWRYIDEKHPALANGDRERHKNVIAEMYERMDKLVGRTMETIDDDTVLFVMSDHGFKPFRRGVDLNAWLLDNGYLALKDGAARPGKSYLADIDWSRTKAYGLGLAGIFLNIEGREGQGIVAPGDAEAVAREIAGKLTGLRDPANGETAIHEAMLRETVYHGPYVETAPDIIIGYDVGYRVSWDAVIGKCGPDVFSDNVKAWSGDHCIHPDLVPGVLFSNRKLDRTDPDILDLAPTVLDLFGVKKPTYMDGESLLCAAAN